MAARMFELEGMTALVTGAGSGIGAAIAAGLASSGVNVGCLDVSKGGLERTLARIRMSTASGEAMCLMASVAEPGAVTDAVQRLESRFGPLQLAVNCAGIAGTGPAETMPADAWQRLININLTGTFLSCQAEARAMLRTGGGSIVNIGSISGTIANRGLKQAHYNAAKAALRHMSRTLALEWADRGVRVNVLSPGYVKTPLAKAVETSRTLEQFIDDIPMSRMAEPAEMVGPAIFLLSQAASYCTAMELLADGGMVAW
jgi:NAD(P)-dependent dehydrogenase (short-subunit alcohol dehydrogenase family)